MGCDGGTIPKRDELVKVKKKPEPKDKQAEISFQWRYCAISQEALEEPIVTCGLGRLYNKSAMIEGLLSRHLLPDCAKHVRSLKDIKDLNLTSNPEYDSNAEKTEGMLDSRAAPFICPITGLEMSGKFRFVCVWTCGCVFSERALKHIHTNKCHKCQQTFTTKDVIILNGNSNDLEFMSKNMEERQAIEKAKKKMKKIGECSTSAATVTSSSTSNKRLIKTDDDTLIDPQIKKIKSDYSVAKDPKVTDVYKSLFTSHHTEKQQTRAHWVTYNPFYN